MAITSRYKAILWDCDGVLVDSELIACRCAAEWVTSLGYPITPEAYVERFMGKNYSQGLKEISAEIGRDLMPTLGNGSFDAFQQRQRDLFNAQLKPVTGIAEVLSSLAFMPMAVASGSDPARLEHTLSLTGLIDYLAPHIYSADMVENGKPAPDIFLFAAEKLGVAPEDCLVVEDGFHGIRAAQAAGMDVVAFTGGSHMTPALRTKISGLGATHHTANVQEILDIVIKRKTA